MRKVILAVVVLLICGGMYVYTHFNTTITSIIETAGTQALGQQVHVGGVEVSIGSESASINSISVDNPEGFAGKFLETKSVTATLGDFDRSSRVVTINQVVIDGLALSYDIRPNGSNFDVIEKHLKAPPTNAPASSPTENAKVDKPAESGGYSLIIKRLQIKNAKVTASIGGSMQKSFTVPMLTISDIGTKDHPATPEQVAKELMQHVIAISSGVATKFSLSALPVGVDTGKVKDTLKGLLSK
jgi:hypothetical protein